MGIKSRLKKSVKALLYVEAPKEYYGAAAEKLPENLTSSEYWTRHNVTLHHDFKNREDSLAFLRWRCSQYLFYDKLMPCSGFDGKVILDYGCGPGHDVIGFLEHSRPARVIAMDVSKTSLAETKKRVAFHNKEMKESDFVLIEEKKKLPLEDNSVDYIHSSGVLHHTPNMPEILDEFYRVLKPGGTIRIMVYNYESIWVHLYVAYDLQMVKGIDKQLSLNEAFRKSTDGVSCPISNFYAPQDFLDICSKSKLKGKYLGGAISLHEMDYLPMRYKAISDIRLGEKHRDFLKELTFDEYQRPLYKGNVAGIDAVFELTK